MYFIKELVFRLFESKIHAYTDTHKPIQVYHLNCCLFQANTKRLQPVSGLLAALLVKYKDLQSLAQRAFITYLRSIYKQRDKEVFDVMKLPIDEFSASLGLPMTPKIRFLNQKSMGLKEQKEPSLPPEVPIRENLLELSTKSSDRSVDDEEEDSFLVKKQSPDVEHGKESSSGNILYAFFST